MTIPQLISETTSQIYRLWYRDRPVHEFKRDERHLTQSIARYGYECERRNWQFDALAIRKELMTLLLKIKTQEANFKYLPIYLEGAVDRHIRYRAEELSAQAKTISRHVAKLVKSVQPGDVRQLTDVEILATLYKDLKKSRSRTARRPGAQQPQKQSQLL